MPGRAGESFIWNVHTLPPGRDRNARYSFDDSYASDRGDVAEDGVSGRGEGGVVQRAHTLPLGGDRGAHLTTTTATRGAGGFPSTVRQQRSVAGKAHAILRGRDRDARFGPTMVRRAGGVLQPRGAGKRRVVCGMEAHFVSTIGMRSAGGGM